MGYKSSHNQWIKIFELIEIDPEVVKTFLRGKKRERTSLRPRKRSWAIEWVFSYAGSYVCIVIKAKVTITRATKFITVVYHHNQDCFCIFWYFMLPWRTLLGFFPWWDKRLSRGFYFCWFFSTLKNQPGLSWNVLWMCFAVRQQGLTLVCLAERSDSGLLHSI